MILKKGSKGPEVRSIQETLNYLHFQGRKSSAASSDFSPLDVDGIFGNDTEDAVMQFQEDVGIYMDGRVGPVTLAALQAASGSRQIELAAPLAVPIDQDFSIDYGPADKFGDGYNRVRLRSDVLVAYKAVYDEVHRHGGLMTSSGGIRDLYAPVGPNRSATSFHYSGRALDLMIFSGMSNPQTDPYVVQRLGDRRYRVYARCDAGRARNGALPPSVTLDDIVSYKSRVRGITLTGHFLDLTDVFDRNGFKPIRARQAFERGGSPLGAEWWHFQYEVGLIPGVSTFGGELRKIYSDAKLRPSPPWKYRDYVFKREWN